MLLTPSKIKWVRNVTRKNNTFAYFDIPENGIFTLHWSSTLRRENHPKRPNPGDIIIITQRSHLTHLVTPVDHDVQDLSKYAPDFRWGRTVQTIAFAEDKIYNLRQYKLSAAAAKFTFPFSNIIGDLDYTEAQEQVWSLFAPHFRTDLPNSMELGDRDDDEIAALEGTEKTALRMHKWRERNSALVYQKKVDAAAKGMLYCSCCGFDFAKSYPGHGNGFIECHHITPIFQGARISKLEDLALVCANCHRMLHRKTTAGTFPSTNDLRDLLA